MLLRIIAVAFSSLATIVSSVLPLYFYYPTSGIHMVTTTAILLIGAILVHGLLTHALNDLTDYHSGTDAYSPGILSGGSKVLQTGELSEQTLRLIGSAITLFLLLCFGFFLYIGQMKFATLIVVGLWGAISYSLKPLRLAYYPFAGEWFSLFPTMFFLGIAAPWILLGTIPLWAWQNASINAFFCMAWVMVHHIPDRSADRLATPLKRTSVVWAEDQFGVIGIKLPTYLYFIIVVIVIIWTAFTRPLGAIGAGLLLLYSFYQTVKMDPEDVEDVTSTEKRLLLLALLTAFWMGICPY